MSAQPSRPLTPWLGVVAVGMIAANLRPGATSVGPALPDVREALDMSATVAGVLTGLPGLSFAVVGAGAVWLASRAGLNRALAIGLVAVAAGLLGRSFATSTPLFLVLSAVALGGAAVGNVLVPAFVKRHYPHRTASLMAVYTVSLAVGALLPGLVHPVVREAAGWRVSLGLWGAGALVALVPWLWLALRERHHRGPAHSVATSSIWSVARSPKAVALAIFFGTQSMQAYVGFGWIPQILVDNGVTVASASLAMAVFSAWGLPMGALAPVLANRWPDRRPIVVACTLVLVAGWAGLLVAPSAAPYVWVSLLGISGLAFPLTLFLVTDLTRDPRITSAVSGFSQSIGYVLASAGPFVVGALYAATGGWHVPLWFLLLTALPFLVAGWHAGKPGVVDDELARTVRPA